MIELTATLSREDEQNLLKLLTMLGNLPPDLTVKGLRDSLQTNHDRKISEEIFAEEDVPDLAWDSSSSVDSLESARSSILESIKDTSISMKSFTEMIQTVHELYDWEKSEFTARIFMSNPQLTKGLEFYLERSHGEPILSVFWKDELLIDFVDQEDIDVVKPAIDKLGMWCADHSDKAEKFSFSDDSRDEVIRLKLFRSSEELRFDHDKSIVKEMISQPKRNLCRKLQETYLKKDYERGPFSCPTYGKTTYLLYKGVNIVSCATADLASSRKPKKKKTCAQKRWESFREHRKVCRGCMRCDKADLG